MVKIAEDWTAEDVLRHDYVKEPYLRIYKIDVSGRLRIYINRLAYDALDKPEYVQILLKSNSSGHMIRLVPSVRGLKNARPLRTTAGMVVMGGGASLVKKYKMPVGYYIMGNQGIFTWKYA